MSQPLPLPSSPPRSPDGDASRHEVDLLAPLRPAALLRVALFALVGGLLGLGAGKLLLRHAEVRAVLRVASVSVLGPAMPLSEVKARAESHGQTVEDLKALGVADAARKARDYHFQADLDGSRDGSMVALSVTGPDAAIARELMARRVTKLVAATHDAFLEASKHDADRLAAADAAQAALRKASSGPDMTAAASFERWAGELAAARRDAARDLSLSRDTEVIDPPYPVESNARALLVAALGCFTGMLLGLGLSLRPAPGA